MYQICLCIGISKKVMIALKKSKNMMIAKKHNMSKSEKKGIQAGNVTKEKARVVGYKRQSYLFVRLISLSKRFQQQL